MDAGPTPLDTRQRLRRAGPIPCRVDAVRIACLAFLVCAGAASSPAQTGAVPEGSQALSTLSVVAFDTETTGLSAERGRVIEIGAVKFRGDRIVATNSWLINPKIRIPKESTRVHGITDAMVSNSPPFSRVFPEFVEFCGGAVLLAHNAGFDVRFIDEELRRNHMGAPTNLVIDTLPLFRAWFPDAERWGVQQLAAHLHLAEGIAHRATSDAETLYGIYRKGVARLPADAMLEDLIRQAGRTFHFRVPRSVPEDPAAAATNATPPPPQ